MDKPGFEEAIVHLRDDTKELKKGHIFGPAWSNHWVKVELSLPMEMRDTDEPVICELPPRLPVIDTS